MYEVTGSKSHLISFLLSRITLSVYIIIKPVKEFVYVGSLLGGCYTLQVPRLLACYAVPPFLTAIIMFSMTAFKCGSTLMTLGSRRTPIITLFMRDGVFWFLAVLLLSIIEIVLWASARPTLAQIPVVPLTALVAIIAARVILNIKQVTSNDLFWDVEATID
ncbi:hypothetical protein B0H14DRAFT_1537463 [Mycena olivaceomarginata]|nr:hypothetical protein B0H14DRAFT_1537463 [Mycena olivaceomarginata]